MSFLIARRRLQANNSARTYRSRPLHPRHIVLSLRSSLRCGETRWEPWIVAMNHAPAVRETCGRRELAR
jgi:hypothetical protein